MANIKEINQNTGERVRNVRISYDMTQEEFGERIGLVSRQVSCIERGKRRLTEDNARLIAKLFPPVRMEYLMGWDDNETEIDKQAADLRKESLEESRDIDTWFVKSKCVEEMLIAFKYVIDWQNEDPPEKRREMWQDAKEWDDLNKMQETLFSENKALKEVFSDESIEQMRSICSKANLQRLASILGEDDLRELLVNADYDEHDNNRWVVENTDAWLDMQRDCLRQKNEVKERQKYVLCDNEANILHQFTPIEYDIFINELYDVVTALIQYHITKGKKKGQP